MSFISLLTNGVRLEKASIKAGGKAPKPNKFKDGIPQDTIRFMLVKRQQGWSAQELADHLDIHFTTVHRILKKHAGENKYATRTKLTTEDKETILRLKEEGVPYKAIAEKYEIHPRTVYKVRRKHASSEELESSD